MNIYFRFYFRLILFSKFLAKFPSISSEYETTHDTAAILYGGLQLVMMITFLMIFNSLGYVEFGKGESSTKGTIIAYSLGCILVGWNWYFLTNNMKWKKILKDYSPKGVLYNPIKDKVVDCVLLSLFPLMFFLAFM